jgi:hypothetical protein
MTTPDPTTPPQMLQLPDWFAGGYVDIEDMVCNYLEAICPNVFVCTWMPPGHYELSAGEPVGGTEPTLRVWRQPGKADPDLRRDEALVQIAAITPTRKESWQLVDFVRRVMDDDVVVGQKIPLTGGGNAKIATSTEWLGPQLIPERVVDEKFVPVTYKLGTRERGGLPKYYQIIKSLLP